MSLPARTGHAGTPADRVPLVTVFKALSDTTRLEILFLLDRDEYTVGQITERFALAQPSISRHLSVLHGAGLVQRRRIGQRVYYRLRPGRIDAAVGEFVAKFQRLAPGAASPKRIAPRRARRARASGA